ncbi:MAG: hypothetical protein D6701_10280, partial [Gemmatimonadetes bacterium]
MLAAMLGPLPVRAAGGGAVGGEEALQDTVRSAAALEHALEAASSPESAERARAARALARHRPVDPRTLEALVALLEDPEDQVHVAALEALGR